MSSLISSTSNLPINSTILSTNSTTDTRRVRLRPKSGINSIASTSTVMAPLCATNGMIFPYTPNISWTQQIEYGNQQLVHTNQDFRYFVRGRSTTFQIIGDFTCENNTTALYTLACLHFLKTVSKMHFGQTDSNRGLPPPMLILSGYGPYMMSDIPVILENFSMTWPQDVDYVSVSINGVNNWLPVTTQISVECTSQQTPQATTQFNYNSYASGQMLQNGGIF